MADRNVTVRLRAEVADFKRSMDDATKTVDKTSAAFDAQGQKIETTSGRMVRSAQINREAWTSTGMVLGGVAAGFGLVATSIARTGIEYNTLQQTSRAALTTLLGGAEAANAQMDQLDDFARNSPFAKQVFINAQRQMLGFGVETAKVLPYLDAIQQSVAAMGGSNQDIAEISNILAKIASQGKITARELMQLGVHGIDAATLIGSQMDMTAGQIRESITAGSIDAMTALDMLTDGMQERFGGAAENVKNTYEGAIDRVKAAWRDLASDLMTPLIDPEGGGVLVDLANNLADLMRWFQSLPDSIQWTVVALGGLIGAAAALGAAFSLLYPRILATVTHMRTLGAVSPGAVAGMGRMAKAAGALALAITGTALAIEGFNRATLETAGTGESVSALLDMAEGASLADTAISNLVERGGFADWFNNNDIESVADAFERINDASWDEKLADGINMVGSFGTSMSAAREQSDELFESLDSGLASLVQSGSLESAEQALANMAAEAGVPVSAMLDLLPNYRNALAQVDNEQRLAAESAGDLTASEERLAGAQERVTGAQEKLTEAREAYRAEVSRWRESTMDAFMGFIDNQGAFDAVVQSNIEKATEHANQANEANARWAREQDGHVEYATKTWEDFYDGITVSAADYIAELQAQVDAQQTWAESIATINERLSGSFSGDDLILARENLEALIQSGGASAGLLETLAGASDSELAEIVGLWAAGGEDAGREFTNQLQTAMDPFVELQLDMRLAQQTLDQWKRQEVVLEVDMVPARTFFGDAPPSGHPASTNPGEGPPLRRVQAPSGRWMTLPGYRDGGPIAGPGTGTSDSIPIMASNGEYMQPTESVSFWGLRAMEHLRNKDVAGLWRELGARGFRDGGSISAPAPQLVTVPVESRYEEHAPLHMTFNGQSAFADGMDYAERRRNSVLGGR